MTRDRRNKPPRLDMTHGARVVAVLLLILNLIIGGSNLLATYLQVHASGQRFQTVQNAQRTEIARLQRSVLSACKFSADLGGAPIITATPNAKASKLGVSIVSDSRVQWHELGCPGQLAAPQPSFVKWARFYHLPTG